eukprot:scaffold108045_cov60-Phaeocystis_antarctica.AAC.2
MAVEAAARIPCSVPHPAPHPAPCSVPRPICPEAAGSIDPLSVDPPTLQGWVGAPAISTGDSIAASSRASMR